MTPTPDDIRKAREIMRVTMHDMGLLSDAIAQALRAEREAERERCAGKECDYSAALRLMKRGSVMRRLAWRPDKWVGVVLPARGLSYLEMTIADGRAAPYTPSRCDQFEDDWVDASESAAVIRRSEP